MKYLSLLLLLALPFPASALSITTWNVEHLMSEATFNQWAEACEKAGWDENNAQDKPRHLTYCNAGNGLSWPCPDKTQSLPLQTPEAYALKVKQLKARAQSLDSDVYAFQEVSDATAVKRLLPQGYQVFFPDDHTAGVPMNVAFAVRDGFKASAKTLPQLSVCENQDRDGKNAWDCKAGAYRTRPGLVLSLQTGDNQKLHLLNIHLKSGCQGDLISQPDLNKPGRACPAKNISKETATKNRTEAKKRGCGLFREQVPVLEQWVEQQTGAGHDFMVLGDFNRQFFKHYGHERDLHHQARLDGSDPASDIQRDTLIGSLSGEINDNDPEGSGLWIVKSKIEGENQYNCTDGNGRDYKVYSCHRGIDHFALGYTLIDRLTDDRKTLQAHGEDYGPEGYCADRAKASDHCPITLLLPQ